MRNAALRLWLPGYHTPSLNRTAGKHWSVYFKLKKAAAGHLLAAVQSLQGPVETLPPKDLTSAACRVLVRLALGLPLEKKGKKPPKPAVPPHLRIERVACVLLDEENFKGGTKGLTDCLRYAFPSWLLDDGPGYVVMEHVQTPCAKRCEEGTWVELACGEREDLGTGRL